MDRLDAMQLFVRVAESGSFSKAARAAGVGQPAVSKQIAALEEHLGAQLLRRTSRGLSMTEAGQDYYEAALRLLGDLEAAESRIGRGQVAPSGLLRVALSAGFGRMYVVPRLPEFFALYPDVSIDIDITERHVNLIEGGLDIAIRIGRLSDSTLVARRIGSVDIATVATPAYLEAHGTPRTPADLEQHACVALVFHGAPRPWEFKRAGSEILFTPQGPLRSNDAEHLRAAVLAGLGLGHNASWLYADELESGAVKRVLADYAPTHFPINAVWPGTRQPSGKVKAFTDFMAQVCAEHAHLKIR